MKDVNTLTIRYLGSNHARFVIEKGGAYWTGTDWSRILDTAQVFFDHKAAQAASWAIQRRRFRGKPTRRFRVNVVVTLTGDDVSDVTEDMLVAYLKDAVRIDIATSEYGEGPLEDVALQATMKLDSLREVLPKS
ncbi:MAG: hypothetical protein ACRCZF_26995 [Gemmataceae bacterium]